MGWYNYYNLLKKYNGDLSEATMEEMDSAALSNPDGAPDALVLARKKYKVDQEANRVENVCPECKQNIKVVLGTGDRADVEEQDHSRTCLTKYKSKFSFDK